MTSVVDYFLTSHKAVLYTDSHAKRNSKFNYVLTKVEKVNKKKARKIKRRRIIGHKVNMKNKTLKSSFT